MKCKIGPYDGAPMQCQVTTMNADGICDNCKSEWVCADAPVPPAHVLRFQRVEERISTSAPFFRNYDAAEASFQSRFQQTYPARLIRGSH
jgi:hypothetical protein